MLLDDGTEEALFRALAAAVRAREAKRQVIVEASAEADALTRAIENFEVLLEIPRGSGPDIVMHTPEGTLYVEVKRLKKPHHGTGPDQTFEPEGIPSGEDFGTPTVSTNLTIGGREPEPAASFGVETAFHVGTNTLGPAPVPTSTDGAVRIVTELNKPMTIADVVAEFQKRGWIDPSWSNPEAAIGQAMRRAADDGRLSRVGRRMYEPPRGVSPLQPVHGLKGLDGQLSRDRRDPVSPLTPQELECLRLVAEGLTNAQIAQQLSVSPNAVRAHIQAMLTKLGMRGRPEGATQATGGDLVENGDDARLSGRSLTPANSDDPVARRAGPTQ